MQQTLKLEILIWDERDNIVTRSEFDIDAEAKYSLLTDDIPYQDRILKREYIDVSVKYDPKHFNEFDLKLFVKHAVDLWADKEAERTDLATEKEFMKRVDLND